MPAVLLPQAPRELQSCVVYKILAEKSTPEDGLAEKVDQFVGAAAPLLDLVIAGPFREYTLHNPEHARKLVHLAGFIISSSTLQGLSALECAVVIFAAFVHDMGMSLTSTERERILKTEDYRRTMREWPELSQRLTSARASLDRASEQESLAIETHIFQIQEAALAAYLRPRHATRERYDHLLSLLETAIGRQDLFTVRGVSFRDALIEICASHNLDVGVLTEVRGPYDDRFPRALPVGGQRLNMQFCAAILRLADILDFDRERTPKILFDSLGLTYRSLPGAEVSLREWRKHMAVHALEFTDHELVISAECHHPAIQSAVLEFAHTIERELRDTAAVLRRNTADVAAKYNIDLPVIVRPRINAVGYVYKEMALRLDESSIMNLLMGERLYKHPGVALRELLQNALDACSVRRLIDPASPQPEISVRVIRDASAASWLEVSDNGIGMDEYVLSEYFLRVGMSYYDSPDFARTLADIHTAQFVPISRFGIGILSVFMIADTLEVTTRNLKSPRSDYKQRTVRVEGKRGLAFVTEADSGIQGTTLRLRLRSEFDNDLALGDLRQYVQTVVVRPRWPIAVTIDRQPTTITSQPWFSVKDDARRQLQARGLEMFAMSLERWSDRLRGTVAIAFGHETEDQSGLLAFHSEGRPIVFSNELRSTAVKVDPTQVFVGYQGNRVTVNGFVMNLKKANRVFGNLKRGIRIAFDIDVIGDTAVKFDVARDRIMGDGASVVRNELRVAIVKGLRELGVFDRLTPYTQALLVGAVDREEPWRQQPGRPEISSEILDAVQRVIPSTPWPIGLHITIAEQLGLSRSTVWTAISELIASSRVAKPTRRSSEHDRTDG